MKIKIIKDTPTFREHCPQCFGTGDIADVSLSAQYIPCPICGKKGYGFEERELNSEEFVALFKKFMTSIEGAQITYEVAGKIFLHFLSLRGANDKTQS